MIGRVATLEVAPVGHQRRGSRATSRVATLPIMLSYFMGQVSLTMLCYPHHFCSTFSAYATQLIETQKENANAEEYDVVVETSLFIQIQSIVHRRPLSPLWACSAGVFTPPCFFT